MSRIGVLEQAPVVVIRASHELFVLPQMKEVGAETTGLPKTCGLCRPQAASDLIDGSEANRGRLF